MNWLEEHTKELNAWEIEAKAKIEKLAESARRSIGQLWRQAKNRVKGNVQ